MPPTSDPAPQIPDLLVRAAFARSAVPPVMQGAPIGFVVDAQGRFGGLDFRIRPVTSSAGFCGPALTVLVREGDNLAAHMALDYVMPGDVLVIAAGGFDRVAVIGEKYAGMAKNKGAVAIVIDGMARDSVGLDRVGIPIFALGVTPNSSFKHGPGQIGVPVSVGGVAVNAGDILCGDIDGVVAVPGYNVAAVAARLGAIMAKEAAMFAAIQAGGPKPAAMASIGQQATVTLID
jgi:4-hydroxy-4-methyl-2-oxoglutarate aldolase